MAYAFEIIALLNTTEGLEVKDAYISFIQL